MNMGWIKMIKKRYKGKRLILLIIFCFPLFSQLAKPVQAAIKSTGSLQEDLSQLIAIEGNDGNIYLKSLETSEIYQITSDAGNAFQYVGINWSPLGDQLAFNKQIMEKDENRYELMILDLRDLNLMALQDQVFEIKKYVPIDYSGGYDWFPSGEEMVYASILPRGDPWEWHNEGLYRFDIITNTSTLMIATNEEFRHMEAPEFSESGEYLTFQVASVEPNGVQKVWVDLTTREIIKVENPNAAFFPLSGNSDNQDGILANPSPDENKLIRYAQMMNSDLEIVDSNGNLIKNIGFYSFISWFPDSDRMLITDFDDIYIYQISSDQFTHIHSGWKAAVQPTLEDKFDFENWREKKENLIPVLESVRLTKEIYPYPIDLEILNEEAVKTFISNVDPNSLSQDQEQILNRILLQEEIYAQTLQDYTQVINHQIFAIYQGINTVIVATAALIKIGNTIDIASIQELFISRIPEFAEHSLNLIINSIQNDFIREILDDWNTSLFLTYHISTLSKNFEDWDLEFLIESYAHAISYEPLLKYFFADYSTAVQGDVDQAVESLEQQQATWVVNGEYDLAEIQKEQILSQSQSAVDRSQHYFDSRSRGLLLTEIYTEITNTLMSYDPSGVVTFFYGLTNAMQLSLVSDLFYYSQDQSDCILYLSSETAEKIFDPSSSLLMCDPQGENRVEVSYLSEQTWVLLKERYDTSVDGFLTQFEQISQSMASQNQETYKELVTTQQIETKDLYVLIDQLTSILTPSQNYDHTPDTVALYQDLLNLEIDLIQYDFLVACYENDFGKPEDLQKITAEVIDSLNIDLKKLDDSMNTIVPSSDPVDRGMVVLKTFSVSQTAFLGEPLNIEATVENIGVARTEQITMQVKTPWGETERTQFDPLEANQRIAVSFLIMPEEKGNFFFIINLTVGEQQIEKPLFIKVEKGKNASGIEQNIKKLIIPMIIIFIALSFILIGVFKYKVNYNRWKKF